MEQKQDFAFKQIENCIIGERLRYIRKKLSLKAPDVAIYLGVNLETLYRYERGKSSIRLNHAKLLSYLYNISIEDILTGNSTII